MYNSGKFGRFKSNCMTEVIASWPALLSWGDLRHSAVWSFTGFKLKLELRGRTLSEVDWLLPSRGKALPSRPSQDWGRNYRQSRGSKIETEARPCEAEARPSQLKKLPRGRLEPRQMPRGLHPCQKFTIKMSRIIHPIYLQLIITSETLCQSQLIGVCILCHRSMKYIM